MSIRPLPLIPLGEAHLRVYSSIRPLPPYSLCLRSPPGESYIRSCVAVAAHSGGAGGSGDYSLGGG